MTEEEIKNEESVEEQEKTAEELEAEGKALDKMTAPELREIAKEIPGVTGVHAMKKPELLSIIKEYRGIKDERPGKRKGSVNIKELKAKIVALRKEKEEARMAGEKRKVDILRRRINRLRKRTRKAA